MIHKKEYIEFEELTPKPKTKVYAVRNIKYGTTLGVIKWYPSWRKYCFFSEGNFIYDVICLTDIREFIQNLMDERMVIKEKEKTRIENLPKLILTPEEYRLASHLSQNQEDDEKLSDKGDKD